MEHVLTELTSGIEERRRTVVRDTGAWSAFWREVYRGRTPRPDLPAIDFSRDMVIVAAMGQRGTGGYTISINDVSRGEEGLLVTVTETAPGAGCMLIQMMTAPVTAVRVPRSDEPVKFVERSETQGCI